MNQNQADQIRVTAFFSGRVQGVGFRNHVNRKAIPYPITGYVQNLKDGRVKVVCEGNTEDIEQFLEQIAMPTAGQVTKVERFQSAPSHEFSVFEVQW